MSQEKLLLEIKKLNKKLLEYDEQYRKKVYPKLSNKQKEKRRLRKINGKLYCDNLVKARNNFFKKEVDAIMQSDNEEEFNKICKEILKLNEVV